MLNAAVSAPGPPRRAVGTTLCTQSVGTAADFGVAPSADCPAGAGSAVARSTRVGPNGAWTGAVRAGGAGWPAEVKAARSRRNGKDDNLGMRRVGTLDATLGREFVCSLRHSDQALQSVKPSRLGGGSSFATLTGLL